MATSFRLPDALKEEAQAYAKALGLSMNGLLAVALRDYLDARRRQPIRPAVPAPLPKIYSDEARNARSHLLQIHQDEATEEEKASWLKEPKGGPRRACRCGSGQQWRHCHGKDQQGPAEPAG